MLIIIAEEADSEIEEAARWYEERSERAKQRFLQELQQTVEGIAKMPTRFMKMRHDPGLQRALMNRYPYLILFRVVDSNTIRIVAVKHEKRDPNYGIFRP